MAAFLETFLRRIKPWLSWGAKIVFLFVFMSLGILVFEWKVLPWLASEDWASRMGIVPKLGERVTVIERKESVSITQDENIERMVALYGSVVVGVLEETVPKAETLALALGQSRSTSGVLVTNDGLLVTYREREPTPGQNHYTVFLGDGQKKEAQVAGYDALTNLLYLRVEGMNTPAIAFTNSADVKPGRRFALLSRTNEATLSVMPSVVGSYERTWNLAPQTVASSEEWEGVYSLGTSVTNGVPGSPALLLNGEVVGVLGAVRVDGTTQLFLVPAKALRDSLDRLIAGKLTRPIAGIYYLTITPLLEQTLALPIDRGAIVYSPSERTGLSVISGSPAALAGLQFGDIVTAVNGAEINLDLPLSVALGRLSVGERAILRILRDGREREVVLSL